MRSFLLKDKRPIVKWGLIPEGIMYQGKLPNGYNLAISPSPGMIIIDIDKHGDKNGFDIIPLEVMKELLDTLHYKTKHDGMHVWVKYTGSKSLGNKTSNKGIDLRTNKGYVVWWNDKPIEDCLDDIKESSPQLNEWLERLFCYKT
jgi:hypothetical protein